MSYQQFKNEWLGRRIDYDHVYAYQCVDLILQYVKEEFGLATGVHGNAIDYWTKPTSTLLTKFDKVSTTDCHQGDIVVFNGRSGNPYGHIGICESQDGSNVTVLEQNGYNGDGSGVGGNAIRTRAIAKSRIAGVLRPKASKLKTNDVIASEVLQGVWGNGQDRVNRLRAAGYNYEAVQAIVNARVAGSAPARKSNDTIAREVIQGKWGNGADRKKRLAAAGYDYNAVQSIVNRLV